MTNLEIIMNALQKGEALTDETLKNYYFALCEAAECKDFRTYSSSCGNGIWAITVEGEDADGDWQDVIFFTGPNGTWDNEEPADLDKEVNEFFEDLEKFEKFLNKSTTK